MNQYEDLKGDINKLSNIITGNGSPENGMVLKLDRVVNAHRALSKDIGRIKNRIWLLIIALLVNFIGFAGGQLWQTNQKVNKLGISPTSAFGPQVPRASVGIESTYKSIGLFSN